MLFVFVFLLDLGAVVDDEYGLFIFINSVADLHFTTHLL